MSTPHSTPRKNLLINPRFQLAYVKHSIGILCTILFVFYASHLYHFWKIRTQGLDAGLPPDHVFFRFLNEQQSSMEVVFLVTALIVAILIVLHGLFVSHKIAGPLYRLRRYFEDHRGHLPKEALKFRKGDYFPEVADSVNDFVKELNK